MVQTIKVGFCVAYDWELLRYSLPLVYADSDFICLSVDIADISWSGEKFELNHDEFNEFISTIDKEKKIHILKENFHNASLTPMQNEVVQRNRMAEFMGKGGWHIQLDCDEYFLKFNSFVAYLKNLGASGRKNFNICCNLITLFKKVENGILVIESKNKKGIESIAIASPHPNYEYGRRNGYFNLYTQFEILHQSWARSESEILTKIKNWGHKLDFDPDAFFSFWKGLNENNFSEVRNFHPIDPVQWYSLKFIKVKSIGELILKNDIIKTIKLSSFDLAIKNSRFISRLRSTWVRLLSKLWK